MISPAPSRGTYLLDTHAFLWLAADDERLSERVRGVALDETNRLVLSVASIWELAIKASVGKLSLTVPLADLIESQRLALSLQLLAISPEHALAVETLDFHHRDPFDRLLVAQAQVEGLPILSVDAELDRYDIERVWN